MRTTISNPAERPTPPTAATGIHLVFLGSLCSTKGSLSYSVAYSSALVSQTSYSLVMSTNSAVVWRAEGEVSVEGVGADNEEL